MVWTCFFHAALVASIALLNALGPERWWVAGVNMFLPQWVWGLPGVVLLPLTAWHARRWTWLPAVTLLFVAGPLMGWCWSFRSDPAGVPLRVMTYNVQLWQRANVRRVVAEIEDAGPDILCLQDARPIGGTALDDLLEQWEVASFGQYVIASRFPIVDSAVGDISYGGERHTYLRARIKVGERHVTVSTAHFATPRDALVAFRAPEFWAVGVSRIKANLSHRVTQAAALANDLRDVTEPLIVAGDLNAPPQSLASRALTDLGLVDVFSAGGRGYGYTFGHTLRGGQSFLRIDRILASRHFATARAQAGGATASDHRPVIADLVLTDVPRASSRGRGN